MGEDQSCFLHVAAPAWALIHFNFVHRMTCMLQKDVQQARGALDGLDA